MSRAHNFSAGPAVLPVSVIEQLSATLPELGETRLGLMELSHRSSAFDAIICAARERLRRLLDVPDDHTVLFLQGGASLQFHMAPLNLAATGEAIGLVETGTWSTKALKEIRRRWDARVMWSGKEGGFRRCPTPDELPTSGDLRYLHYTSNNTIYGTRFAELPAAGGPPLVADMSSDICSRPVDVSRHAVLFAGAQKNLGPSGVTAVILSPWAVERSRAAGAANGGLPTMLDYALQTTKGSMFNTPNTFGVFALERVLAWVEDGGGVAAMADRNESKAGLLYDELDRSEMWQPHAETGSRSLMNVTWRIADRDLEPVFLSGAAEAGLLGLKGHRSVGGLRASIYNACPRDSVEDLVTFMREFERTHG